MAAEDDEPWLELEEKWEAMLEKAWSRLALRPVFEALEAFLLFVICLGEGTHSKPFCHIGFDCRWTVGVWRRRLRTPADRLARGLAPGGGFSGKD